MQFLVVACIVRLRIFHILELGEVEQNCPRCTSIDGGEGPHQWLLSRGVQVAADMDDAHAGLMTRSSIASLDICISHLLCIERTCLIDIDAHKIGQARDLEDLDVMVAQAASDKATLRCTRFPKQADDQRNAGAVDIIHRAEVEHDELRVVAFGIGVGAVQAFLREAVNLTL